MATKQEFQMKGKIFFKWFSKKVQRGIQVSETKPGNFVGIITNAGKRTGMVYWNVQFPNPVFFTDGKRVKLTAEKMPYAVPFLEAVKETCIALASKQVLATNCYCLRRKQS